MQENVEIDPNELDSEDSLTVPLFPKKTNETVLIEAHVSDFDPDKPVSFTGSINCTRHLLFILFTLKSIRKQF